VKEVAKEIWEHNYCAPGEKSPKDTWKRLAKGAAQAETPEKREEIEKLFLGTLTDWAGIPGGRINANLGVKEREATTLMNCFVHHPGDIGMEDPDSLTGIMRLLTAQAQTLKSEGGYGMNFSWIRPDGSYVRGIGSRTPGVLKFMELWDKSSEIITMGSDKVLGPIQKDEKKKIRKGAQMGILEVWHPEIMDFIDAKLTAGRLSKFNISVGVTDGFMDALNNDGDWDLKFPDTSCEAYKTDWTGNLKAWEEAGHPVKVYETIKASDLWDKLMVATYTRNDPGVLFLDIANELNPLAYCENIATTNPCGEISMSTGVCNLFSVNLVKHIKRVDGKLVFDFDKFKHSISVAVRFSDNINDISRVPLDEYKASMQEKRRIGIGTLGLGSLHLMMGIKYGGEESLSLIDDIYRIKCEAELLASANLGVEKGSFTEFDKDEYFSSKWWKTLSISADVKKEVESIGHMRNSHRSANAPTGNMGVYAGLVSGGIEPVFMLSYLRWAIVPEKDRMALKKKGLVFCEALKGEWFETEHFKASKRGTDEIFKGTFNGQDYEIDKNRGLIKSMDIVDYGWDWVQENVDPKEIERIQAEGGYQTTTELSVSDHLETLKLIAKYTDMNSSKTINLPNDYPFEDFKGLYQEAWKSGIKGVTTYRDGTMTVVLEKKEEIKEEQTELEKKFTSAEGVILEDVSLPEEHFSKGYTVKSFEKGSKKKWYINIGFADEGMTKPFVLFVNTNSHEGTEVTDDTVQDMMELAKKAGIKKALINDQIDKFSKQSNVKRIARSIGFLLRHNVPIIDIVDVIDNGGYPMNSLTFHLKRLLKQFIKAGTKVTNSACQECGGELIMESGCFLCKDCSWSKCG